MQEKLKDGIDELVDKWKGLTSKQKGYIIATLIALIACLILTIVLTTRTTWKRLNQEPMSSTMTWTLYDSLKAANIKSRISGSETYVEVDEKQYEDAKKVVIDSGITDEGFTFSDALEKMGMGTTSDVRKKITQESARSKLESDLASFSYIDKATVNLFMQDDTNFYLNAKQDPRAAVMISTKSNLSDEQIESVVKYIKASVNGLERKNIELTDSRGNILFSGEDNGDGVLSANATYKIEVQKRVEIEKNARELFKPPIFDSVEAKASVKVTSDKSSQNKVEYQSPIDDSTVGIPLQQNTSESSATNTSTGSEPGLTQNGGNITQYQTGNNAGSQAKSSDRSTVYGVNKTEITTETIPGEVLFNESSISLIGYKNRIYREVELENQGIIGGDTGLTWQQYQDQIINEGLVTIQYDPNLVNLVSNATGIPVDRISIMAYENPIFEDSPAPIAPPISTYAMLAILVLLIALLAFALIKKTAPAEITEIEQPELDIETVLTEVNKRQEYVSPIDYDSESEIKKQIEKFVDERPEAVAQLLRNWLSSEWE